MRHHFAILMLCLAFALPAQAETVNCTAIDHLPATISTQGVFCLKNDLSTAIGAGDGIAVAANNVTIDCNGYKLGGLAAGAQTRAHGVRAVDRSNVTVRNCNVRGFHFGILMQGGAGHVVEDNRLDGNTYAGVGAFGSDGVIIRNNYVVDTGGNLPLDAFPNGRAFGIGVQPGDALLLQGNTVINTYSTAASNGNAIGIGLFTTGGVVQDNKVINVVPDGTGQSQGLLMQNAGTRLLVRGNSVVNLAPATGNAVLLASGAVATCQDNLAKGFSVIGFSTCVDAGGNYSD